MKKRNGHLWNLFLCLLFLLLFCSACKQKEPPQSDTTGGNPTQILDNLTPYYMTYGYFYLEDEILLSSDKRMMYSDWEETNFKYICSDLTCEHSNNGCSAFFPGDENRVDYCFAVYYQDKLIIVNTYEELGTMDSETSDVDFTNWSTWKTEVYEADKDGNNRKLVAAFDGGVLQPNRPKAALLLGDTLYFGGQKKESVLNDYNEESGELESTVVHNEDAFFALNLSDYSVECFAEEEKADKGYIYELYYKDGFVYAIEHSDMAGKVLFFRFDIAKETCEKLVQFDSDDVWFSGVIDNQLFYEKDNEIVAFDMDKKKSKVFYQVENASAFVLGNEIFVRTEYSAEEGKDYVVYTSFDKSGEKIKEYYYDEYFTFLTTFGDKVIYIKPRSDKQEWWCNVSDIEDLLKKGEYIGPFIGTRNDTLE